MRTSPARAVLTAAVAAGTIAVVPAAAQAGPILAPQNQGDPASPVHTSYAVATGGNGVVAHAFTTLNRLRVAVREPGAATSAAAPRGFSASVDIGPYSGTFAGEGAQLSVDDAGTVTAAISVATPLLGDDAQEIWVRTKAVGSAWTPAVKLTTYDLTKAGEIRPKLVAAKSGRAAILTSAGVFERSTATGAFALSAGTTAAEDLAGNAAGELTASWIAGGQVTVSRKPVGGTWSTPQTLGAHRAPVPFLLDVPTVAVTTDGKSVVAWYGRDAAGRLTLVSRTFTPAAGGGGTWAPLVTSTTAPNASEDYVTFGHSLQADGPGRARLSWYDPAGVFKEQALPGGSPATPSKPLPFPRAYDPATGRGFAAGWLTDGVDGIAAWYRPGANTAVTGPTTIAVNTGDVIRFDTAAVALDEQGNGWVSVLRTDGNQPGAETSSLAIYGYDPVAPKIASLTVPASATTGTPVAFAASASDRMSGVTYAWSFGDGGTATGAAPTRTFAAAGTYDVKVTVTDEAGNTASQTKPITVTSGAPQLVDANPKLWTPTLTGGQTVVRTLELFNLRKSDNVRVRCDGPGCTVDAFKNFWVQEPTAKLVTRFADPLGVTLGTGAILKVSVLRTGWKTQVARFTMQNGKAPVRVTWHE